MWFFRGMAEIGPPYDLPNPKPKNIFGLQKIHHKLESLSSVENGSFAAPVSNVNPLYRINKWYCTFFIFLNKFCW